MRYRPDLLDDHSPKGLEVIQLTTGDCPASHIYMEAQIFTPDSKGFLLHAPAAAHPNQYRDDPGHAFLYCDIEDKYRLHPLIRQRMATAPSVSPDGSCVYYFVDETRPGGGRLTLKRIGIDGSGDRTILVLDAPLPGASLWPSQLYPLSTISSDGRRLAISCFLGDGNTRGAPFALLVFDLEQALVQPVLQGPSWCNMHPQYSRSPDPPAARDILVQENHGCVCDRQGGVAELIGGAGADIHVIRDDGSGFRDLPWGRDGVEFCQGHQCWRGRDTWAITSTYGAGAGQGKLIESPPVAAAGHAGLKTPGDVRNDLSRNFPRPGFSHFGADSAGRRLVSDCEPFAEGGRLFLAELPAGHKRAVKKWTYLLRPRSSWNKDTHIHPFLSPDGTMAFFNSDESGLLQAYMVRGW